MKAISIPSVRGLLTGGRRVRYAAVSKSASVPALLALLFIAGTAFSVVFLGPFDWPPAIASFLGGEGDDVTRGEWVRDPSLRPYYTNSTCAFIEDYQNCMKHGRPSLEFLRWRWRPAHGDDLPRFDAARFLTLLRGKSVLFVGDSLASSHVRSLVCTLAQVAPAPARMESLLGGFQRWTFPAHDVSVSFFWTPFQVRWRLTRGPDDAVGPDRQGEVFAGPTDLHLDEADARWITAVPNHDVVVISASHWFARPAVYYRAGRAVGCHQACDGDNNNLTAMKPWQAQREAFRTVLRTLAGTEGFKGAMILRTVAPTHYENGGWFDGGECTATEPATDPDEDPVEMAEPEAEFYKAQVEEFRAAEAESPRRMRLMDVTGMMLRRPDGHPDRYGHGPGQHEGFNIDCLHWCLPGPIDVWNELLMKILTDS
ncbi:hypothetical protein PR202_ga17209 [Eleusine coracana subsp. coracana]|uniref:Trichome birefringence-like N-terminal domain-containing protein n=1 Tax=Eleusine coracana subsp. coracana TaxID=191504 RepID=A0AAV5CPE6_ELECO|nr:hypothetical protein QOZ80_6AG0516930 [Eleusine coracana subsp. coracana]GJN00056.1 hypothetical protein PR202_ga17209 [Eleusine coracana subsp. coracana]